REWIDIAIGASGRLADDIGQPVRFNDAHGRLGGTYGATVGEEDEMSLQPGRLGRHVPPAPGVGFGGAQAVRLGRDRNLPDRALYCLVAQIRKKIEPLRIAAEIENDRLRLGKLWQRHLEFAVARAIEIDIGNAGLQLCDCRRARLVSRIHLDTAKHALALLAILALDLEAHDRAVRSASELAWEIRPPGVRRGAR